jgi:hypothetical protein
MAADDLPKSDPLNFSPKLGESSSPLDLKSDWSSRIEALKQQEADLKRTIADLQGTARGLTTDQMGQLQADLKAPDCQGDRRFRTTSADSTTGNRKARTTPGTHSGRNAFYLCRYFSGSGHALAGL